MPATESNKLPASSSVEPTDIAHQLMHADAFQHDVSQLKLLETHISWILLTGKYAYKIKKPVKLPFVDYSTLNQRAKFCHEELRLNSRLAPDIYLDVVPIMRCGSRLMFDYDGFVVDYAVRMKEFPQENIFDRLLEDDKLTADQIDQLGRLIARTHRTADVASDFDADQFANDLHQQITETTNFLASAFKNSEDIRQVGEIADWIEERFVQLQPTIARRLETGFVRMCHGDMHLQNIILFDDKVEVFDCIEFSRELQFIDTINDIAFPVMDFLSHDRADLARRLLTRYLEETGDYEGLELLKFCVAYRALVRAKVSLLRDSQASTIRTAEHYLQTAVNFAKQIEPRLSITFGVSGSGKSTRAMEVVERTGAIRIRSDVERTRLFADEPTERKYSADANKRVYQRLFELAERVVATGFPVVVDATFLKASDRSAFAELAHKLGVPFEIIQCESDTETLKQRVAARTDDVSEATVELIDKQLASLDPLSDSEMKFTAPN